MCKLILAITLITIVGVFTIVSFVNYYKPIETYQCEILLGPYPYCTIIQESLNITTLKPHCHGIPHNGEYPCYATNENKTSFTYNRNEIVPGIWLECGVFGILLFLTLSIPLIFKLFF